MAKGYISEFINGGRIVSHGVITSEMIKNGFKINNGSLFTIYIRPKVTMEDIDIALPVKLYQDDELQNAPFAFNEWSPLLIEEIGVIPDTTLQLLENCDIYWGSGSYVGTKRNG